MWKPWKSRAKGTAAKNAAGLKSLKHQEGKPSRTHPFAEEEKAQVKGQTTATATAKAWARKMQAARDFDVAVEVEACDWQRAKKPRPRTGAGHDLAEELGGFARGSGFHGKWRRCSAG